MALLMNSLASFQCRLAEGTIEVAAPIVHFDISKGLFENLPSLWHFNLLLRISPIVIKVDQPHRKPCPYENVEGR